MQETTPTAAPSPLYVTSPTRRASKRGALLRAAREEFAMHGYVGAHIAAIAARAGMGKATFFHYYAGKQSLYDAAVGNALGDIADAVARVVGSAPGFGERLDGVVECVHEHIAADATLARVLFRSLLDRQPGTRTPSLTVALALGRIFSDFAETIQLGVREARIPPMDAAREAPAIVAMLCAHNGAVSVESAAADGQERPVTVADAKARVRRFLGVR